MLAEQCWRFPFKDSDLACYEQFLPAEHPLMDAAELIPWDSLVAEMESYYPDNTGQPPLPPLLLLKIEFLRYFFRLSDRQVLSRTQTDTLFRWFLRIPIQCRLPVASTLSRFRARLGSEGFKKIFQRLIACAREANLVRDRLRLKDASHVIANIAVPTTLVLVAQLRDRLIAAVSDIDQEAADGFEIEAARIREETDNGAKDIRLEARVRQVQDLVDWIAEQTRPRESNAAWEELQEARRLAEKILTDQANPEQGHRTLSIVDSDARRGKHGDWYDGYVIDIMMDADSELITEVEVLEAGGDEAQDAVALVQSEQETHGNQIEHFSIDGAGFHGPMLRELEDPEGLNVDVITPPKKQPESDVFANSLFELSDDGASVTCPAGEQSSYRQRDKRNATIFRFKRFQCESCPLRPQCKPDLGKPTNPFGRSVTKNDYEPEYERARAKSQTPEYAEIRRRHPAVERKLNEVMNHQRGRRAQYWGHEKVKLQEYMTCFTVNVKRMIKLMSGTVCAEPA